MELEIYDNDGNLITTTESMFTASSSYSTNVPGNLATGVSGRWVNNSSNKANNSRPGIPNSAWLQLDLGTSMNVSYVRVKPSEQFGGAYRQFTHIKMYHGNEDLVAEVDLVDGADRANLATNVWVNLYVQNIDILNVNGNLKVNSCSDDVNEVVSNYPIYTYRPNSENENNAMVILGMRIIKRFYKKSY